MQPLDNLGFHRLFGKVLCHTRRNGIYDRLHRANDASVTRKQHPCSNMDGLVGEFRVARRCLTCRKKGCL